MSLNTPLGEVGTQRISFPLLGGRICENFLATGIRPFFNCLVRKVAVEQNWGALFDQLLIARKLENELRYILIFRNSRTATPEAGNRSEYLFERSPTRAGSVSSLDGAKSYYNVYAWKQKQKICLQPRKKKKPRPTDSISRYSVIEVSHTACKNQFRPNSSIPQLLPILFCKCARVLECTRVRVVLLITRHSSIVYRSTAVQQYPNQQKTCLLSAPHEQRERPAAVRVDSYLPPCRAAYCIGTRTPTIVSSRDHAAAVCCE